MKKALVALLALSFASCDCTDYAEADKNTYLVLKDDILLGIENNPQNSQENKDVKFALVQSWVFRFESELKKGDK